VNIFSGAPYKPTTTTDIPPAEGKIANVRRWSLSGKVSQGNKRGARECDTVVVTGQLTAALRLTLRWLGIVATDGARARAQRLIELRTDTVWLCVCACVRGIACDSEAQVLKHEWTHLPVDIFDDGCLSVHLEAELRTHPNFAAVAHEQVREW
jgi:hypothetical protein